MKSEEESEGVAADMTRRDFLKAGACCAGAVICGIFGRGLLLADNDIGGKKGVMFKIVRGNKCNRCQKVLQEALTDKDFRDELSQYFKKGQIVFVAFGGRAKLNPESTNIAFGRCARNLNAKVVVPTGCPPKKEQLLAAVKNALGKD